MPCHVNRYEQRKGNRKKSEKGEGAYLFRTRLIHPDPPADDAIHLPDSLSCGINFEPLPVLLTAGLAGLLTLDAEAHARQLDMDEALDAVGVGCLAAGR